MENLRIVALAGGVGGAKLADGLAQVMQPNLLTVIVNTADDFTHLGLRISPDIDTVCYALAGIENPQTGWGRKDETWNFMKALSLLGMPDWFQLGDADLATHVVRTQRFGEGMTLSQITGEMCRSWGVEVKVLPMSDETIQTRVFTNGGELGFQEYFVHRHCEPRVSGFRFEGIQKSIPAPGVRDAIDQCDAVVICPSNPWVSIDPILAVPSIKSEIKKHLVMAVSPIIGNHTIKGPAAKMFSELGIQPSAQAVADHYRDLIDAILIDSSDASQAKEIESNGIHVALTDIWIKDRTDRGRLAGEVLKLLADLHKGDEQ